MGNALCVVQAQRHVHSATCSGLSAGFARSPQAFAGEVDAVGVMHQAVENGVGVGGIADQRVPLIDGKLTGDDGGAAAPFAKPKGGTVSEPEEASSPRATSSRNDGRDHLGMAGEIKSERWRDHSGMVGDIERNQHFTPETSLRSGPA